MKEWTFYHVVFEKEPQRAELKDAYRNLDNCVWLWHKWPQKLYAARLVPGTVSFEAELDQKVKKVTGVLPKFSPEKQVWYVAVAVGEA
jgi:hypothetical protein